MQDGGGDATSVPGSQSSGTPHLKTSGDKGTLTVPAEYH